MNHDHEWMPDGTTKKQIIPLQEMPEKDWDGCSKKFCPHENKPHTHRKTRDYTCHCGAQKTVKIEKE